MSGVLIKTRSKRSNRRVFWVLAEYSPVIELDNESLKVRVKCLKEDLLDVHVQIIKKKLKRFNVRIRRIR